jgi:hypothetical protein
VICVCEHHELSHKYRTTTRRNDGRCLSLGCTCTGMEGR